MEQREPSFWEWVEADDLDRLAVAHEALCAALLAEPSEAPLAAELEALETERGRLLDPAPGPPLARWALRVCDHLGLAGAAGQAARVVALFADGRAHPGSDDLQRWGLAFRLLAIPGVTPTTADVAAWLLGRARAGRARFDRNPEVGDGAAAAVDPHFGALRLELVLGLPALLAGRDPADWLALARAAAPLVALLESWERLFLDPEARDVDDATLSSWVRHGVVGPTGPAVLQAYAGDRRSKGRRDEVLSALSHPALEAAVRASWRLRVQQARATLTAETAVAGHQLLDGLERGFAWAGSYTWARSLFARPSAPGWSAETLAIDVQRATERIARDPGWSSSIDVQRWGVEEMSAELVADWFPRGLIELGLREVGEVAGGRDDHVRALLLEIPPGELRYFRGWRGIPPDADSLGLMLQLAAKLPDPPLDRLESWLVRMEENLGADGVPRVWFRRSSAGPTHDPPDREWQGDACTACLLSLALGLIELDPGRFDTIITAIVTSTLGRFQGGSFSGSWHYPAAFASYLFVLVTVRLASSGAAAPVRDQARRCGEALVGALGRGQRLDGSWGSPQHTAWALEALCLLEPETGAVTRAARFLSETQRGDGSWLPELLYYAVGKPGYMIEYRGIEVTTAICARALAVARRTLEGGRQG